MRKAILLYNPSAGRSRSRRQADVAAALSVLRSARVEASAVPTRGASDAADQTRQAIADGCDTVFACGGDGTVHDVLQGLVGTQAALAIIPLGTANSLAHDLQWPIASARAAQAALTAEPRRIPVGHIEYRDFVGKRASRHFTVTVGIGVDAQLFYELNPLMKRNLGMFAYCMKATRLWLLHKLENFTVEFTEESKETRHAEVSQLLAVRIRDFGGILRQLAPGATLERDDLRLVLFRTRSRLAYLGYVLRGLFGTNWRIPGIQLVDGLSVACYQLMLAAESTANIYVEADGELLGTLPVEITMIPDAITILVPQSRRL